MEIVLNMGLLGQDGVADAAASQCAGAVNTIMRLYENYFLDTITFITSLQKVGK